MLLCCRCRCREGQKGVNRRGPVKDEKPKTENQTNQLHHATTNTQHSTTRSAHNIIITSIKRTCTVLRRMYFRFNEAYILTHMLAHVAIAIELNTHRGDTSLKNKTTNTSLIRSKIKSNVSKWDFKHALIGSSNCCMFSTLLILYTRNKCMTRFISSNWNNILL